MKGAVSADMVRRANPREKKKEKRRFLGDAGTREKLRKTEHVFGERVLILQGASWILREEERKRRDSGGA